MSNISNRFNFYTCKLYNLIDALAQKQFNIVLSSYCDNFSYYKTIKAYEENNNAYIPILQVCKELDTSYLQRKHLLTIVNDPNTKLRIKALYAGAADAVSEPYNVQELLARLNRLAYRVELYENEYKQFTKSANEKIKKEYDAIDKGYSLGEHLFVADYDFYLCSDTGLQIKLTPKERTILKALVEADGQPITKKQLSEYLNTRNLDHNYDSLAVLIGILNKKLETRNLGYRIKRMPSYGYILNKI